ncbi:hypothetical protein [Olleya sp. Bg11-27]|uniref:hypothetical protein n=1 Tax=Olleya sp. Bg11-27 TaxID=2058135 RepID=UPI0018E25BC9|nr:hypothetical protein [Olleya sp. Bg11-27]
MIDKNINAISTTKAPTDSLSITKLPYSFQYDYENPLIEKMTIEQFFKNRENHIANVFFSDSTNLTSNTFQHINYKPYVGKGVFVKKFPDFKTNKLMLFAYDHSSLNYFLPIFELQMFDENDKIIDKLIVVGGREYECGWNRYFKIEKNFTILIHNSEFCYDIEEDKEIFRNEIDTKYKITLSGFEKTN